MTARAEASSSSAVTECRIPFAPSRTSIWTCSHPPSDVSHWRRQRPSDTVLSMLLSVSLATLESPQLSPTARPRTCSKGSSVIRRRTVPVAISVKGCPPRKI
eukprot:2506595-Rhodomonas_salina.3